MEGFSLQRVVLAAVVLLAAAAPARALSNGDTRFYPPSESPGDAIPQRAATFGTSDEVTRHLVSEVVRSAPEAPETVLRRPSLASAAALEPDGDPAVVSKRRYLPIFLSVLVPGAGEMYMGYWKRGVALMAIEAGAWSGYVYKHQQGLDTREEYEDFADAHWDMRKFIDDHYLIYPSTGATLEQLEEQGQATSGSGAWPGYSPWVSKEEDKQHYYENIGKYDWYVSGWDDYAPGTRPEDLNPGEVLSRSREEYRDLRHESNNQLDAANRFIYLSIATRVFSLVQTTLLVTRSSSDDMARTDNHWILHARSRGRAAGELALEYWFK
jgi:hypothetical protein